MNDVDWQARRRAREARDPRFDGKFFVGILSTKIYCRPSCPVPTVPDKNLRYFETAAAATAAGFRPCLRCRPECSPGTPAWSGTPATVSRALRLIAEGDLETGGVEKLAQRLGIGSRHLRRLFLQHVGATPSAVAQTRRLHFAKKLIDETSLPMTQVALASGFASVRRFNAAIRATYKRTPTHIRKLARIGRPDAEDTYVFRLAFRPPYDWHGMLAHLADHALPGIECVEGAIYRRTIAIGSNRGWLEVAFDEANHCLVTHLHYPDPCSLFLIVERIRTMFDLNADWMTIAAVLGSDPTLAPLIDRAPGLRVIGCWDPFEVGVRAILIEGRVPSAAAIDVLRFTAAVATPYAPAPGLTHLFPSPDSFLQRDVASVPGNAPRVRLLHAYARGLRDGQIKFEAASDTEEVLHQLSRLGFAPASAQYIAMRTLADPDAFPSSDPGVQQAMQVTDAAELEHRADGWRPWRAYAAMYLWNQAAQETFFTCQIQSKPVTELRY